MPKKSITQKTDSSSTTKTAAKKSTTKTTTRKAATKKENPKTCIIAQFDVGFGNTLYIRGEGAGLSWERGLPMENTSQNEWNFTAENVKEEVSFKFLINDEVWAEGENLKVAPDNKSISSPVFSGW